MFRSVEERLQDVAAGFSPRVPGATDERGLKLAATEEAPGRQGWQPRLTRRQLFKLGGVAATVAVSGAVAARAAQADELIRGGRSVSRTTGATRRAVASTCAHCTARCGILGFVEENRLVKIEGNPRDPNSRGRICARGHAGINRLYDPDRVLFPMERAGRRGEGKWVRISWEQAYDTLEARLTELQGRAPESLVLHTGLEGPGLLARRFVGAFGSKLLIDEASLREANREAANRMTMGANGEVVDVARAHFIINFGGNPYESHPAYVPFVQRLVDARMGGAKLVTFDPRLSLTAGRSDEWFPVVPGTDGLIALAMANVILQQGLHDREFLIRWTDLTPEDLEARLAPYTPEMAETASGVRAADLRRIATEFGRIRPAVALFGGGVKHQKGAIDAQRAVILLNAVVGSVGARGGYSPAPTVAFPNPEPALPPPADCSEALQFVEEFLQGKKTAGIYITSMANPAYSWPNSEAFRKALEDENRVAYLVSIDTNLTETSMLADMVLPAATYLESWGLESPTPQELVPYVALRQPVVQARGESLSADDILLTLGTRLAGEATRYFAFPTVESYIDSVVSKLPGLADAGGLGLLREQGIWYDVSAAPQYLLSSKGFATPSGKLEFAFSFPGSLVGDGQAVGVSRVAPDSGTGELTLITYHPNVHFGDYSANCWWLAEIAHTNELLINPTAAQRRGIKQGQMVKVTSSAGTVEVRARITQGIHPGVVALASGFGHEGVGRIARGERFKSDDPMTLHVWWDGTGNGANASALFSSEARESGGGLVWMDTRVTVQALA